MILGFALGVGAGCASMEARERMDTLDLSMAAYGNALRWGDYEAAAQYRVSRTGPYPPIAPEAFRSLRVASYDVVSMAVDSAQMEAAVSTVIRYYREDVGRVETVRDRQRWWYNPALRRWFLDGDLPDFSASQ
jgi:hypothetical protein